MIVFSCLLILLFLLPSMSNSKILYLLYAEEEDSKSQPNHLTLSSPHNIFDSHVKPAFSRSGFDEVRVLRCVYPVQSGQVVIGGVHHYHEGRCVAYSFSHSFSPFLVLLFSSLLLLLLLLLLFLLLLLLLLLLLFVVIVVAAAVIVVYHCSLLLLLLLPCSSFILLLLFFFYHLLPLTLDLL